MFSKEFLLLAVVRKSFSQPGFPLLFMKNCIYKAHSRGTQLVFNSPLQYLKPIRSVNLKMGVEDKQKWKITWFLLHELQSLN